MQKKRRKKIFKQGVLTTIMAMTVLSVFLFFTASAGAGEAVVVIVNADNPVKTLSVEDVRHYYENDVLNWPNGKKIHLYDLLTQDPAREKFSDTVLEKDAQKVAMEWAGRKITQTAKNPPKTVRSATLMQARVARDPNAIGYLLKGNITSKKVKVVTTIE